MHLLIWLLTGLTVFTAEKDTQMKKIMLHRTSADSGKIAAIAIDSSQNLCFIDMQENTMRFSAQNSQSAFVMKNIPLAVKISQNGLFAAALGKRTSEKESGLTLAILNRHSSTMSTAFIENDSDEPLPELEVNFDGTVALGRVPQNSISIFNFDGYLQQTFELFSTNQYALERSLKIAFAPDGQSFYTAAMCLPAHPGNELAQQNVRLARFDLQGNEQWYIEMPEQALGGLQPDETGEKLALYTYDAFSAHGIKHVTRIISVAGEIHLEIAAGFRDAQFSKSGKTLLLTHKRRAALYIAATGQLQTAIRIQAPAMIISAVPDATEENFTLLSGISIFEKGIFQFVRNTLQKIDFDGRMLAKVQLEETLTPQAKLYAAGAGKMILADDYRIERIEWLSKK